MKRTILLTAAVAALTAALAPNNASADEPAAASGQISENLLAQFGLGDSESVSDADGLEIRGMGGKKKLKTRYNVEIKNLSREGKLRKVKRTLTKKSVVKLKRQKKGIYSVRYRPTIKSTKKTASRPSYSGANRFNVR